MIKNTVVVMMYIVQFPVVQKIEVFMMTLVNNKNVQIWYLRVLTCYLVPMLLFTYLGSQFKQPSFFWESMERWKYSLFTKRRALVCLSSTWETKCSRWIFCTPRSFQIEPHRERWLMGWLIHLISHFSAESNSEKTSLPFPPISVINLWYKCQGCKMER